MSGGETWTVGRLLEWTTAYLRQHGSNSPRLDAELLLAEVLGCARIGLYTSFDQVPSEELRAEFRKLIQRRAQGMPVAYLLGHREFYSLNFWVTPDVLIPRPETELLVVSLLDLAKSRPTDQTCSICDVGTGSGILAVCAAKYLPHAHIVAIDISLKALEVARSNCQQHGVENQVHLVAGNLLTCLAPQARFHFILANPPYVAEKEWESLPRDVRKYEPPQALLAGPQGTEVIARLVPQAAEHLDPGGWLLLEISPTIHQQVQEILQQDGRWQLGPTRLDLARLPRILPAQRKPEDCV